MLSLTGGNYDHNLTDRHNNTAPAADTARRIPTGDAAVRLALAAVTRQTATRAIQPDTTHRYNLKWKSCHTWVTSYRVASGRCPRLTGRGGAADGGRFPPLLLRVQHSRWRPPLGGALMRERRREAEPRTGVAQSGSAVGGFKKKEGEKREK